MESNTAQQALAAMAVRIKRDQGDMRLSVSPRPVPVIHHSPKDRTQQQEVTMQQPSKPASIHNGSSNSQTVIAAHNRDTLDSAIAQQLHAGNSMLANLLERITTVEDFYTPVSPSQQPPGQLTLPTKKGAAASNAVTHSLRPSLPLQALQGMHATSSSPSNSAGSSPRQRNAVRGTLALGPAMRMNGTTLGDIKAGNELIDKLCKIHKAHQTSCNKMVNLKGVCHMKSDNPQQEDPVQSQQAMCDGSTQQISTHAGILDCSEASQRQHTSRSSSSGRTNSLQQETSYEAVSNETSSNTSSRSGQSYVCADTEQQPSSPVCASPAMGVSIIKRDSLDSCKQQPHRMKIDRCLSSGQRRPPTSSIALRPWSVQSRSDGGLLQHHDLTVEPSAMGGLCIQACSSAGSACNSRTISRSASNLSEYISACNSTSSVATSSLSHSLASEHTYMNRAMCRLSNTGSASNQQRQDVCSLGWGVVGTCSIHDRPCSSTSSSSQSTCKHSNSPSMLQPNSRIVSFRRSTSGKESVVQTKSSRHGSTTNNSAPRVIAKQSRGPAAQVCKPGFAATGSIGNTSSGDSLDDSTCPVSWLSGLHPAVIACIKKDVLAWAKAASVGAVSCKQQHDLQNKQEAQQQQQQQQQEPSSDNIEICGGLIAECDTLHQGCFERSVAQLQLRTPAYPGTNPSIVFRPPAIPEQSCTKITLCVTTAAAAELASTSSASILGTAHHHDSGSDMHQTSACQGAAPSTPQHSCCNPLTATCPASGGDLIPLSSTKLFVKYAGVANKPVKQVTCLLSSKLQQYLSTHVTWCKFDYFNRNSV